MLIKKIPDTSGLVTATLLNTKISEVENKFLYHDKYITTPEFNKLTAEEFAGRLKQVNLVKKTDFDSKLISFNRKITSNGTKYLEVQRKLNTLTTKHHNFCTDFVLSWKSKGVYNSKLKPLHTAFLHSLKLSEYKMRIKFDKDPLTVDQNIYASKIVKVYTVHDLDAWPGNPTNNFKFKNCLFGATSDRVLKNSDKEKYVYSVYEITFDSTGSWSFNKDIARNIRIFSVDNSSSFHADNETNNVLVLGEGPTFGINGRFG